MQVLLFSWGSWRSHWETVVVFFTLGSDKSQYQYCICLVAEGESGVPCISDSVLKPWISFYQWYQMWVTHRHLSSGMASSVSMRTWEMVSRAEFRLNCSRKEILLGSSPLGCFAVNTENQFWHSDSITWPNPHNNQSTQHEFSHKIRQARASECSVWRGDEKMRHFKTLDKYPFDQFQDLGMFCTL